MSKYLITSALPYINGVKHLGNLIGSLLPADAYARFLRLEGEDVLFICATDEHGTPAELSALESGFSVEDYCDAMYFKQSLVYAQFGISFDHFGRTSSPQNQALTTHFYERLNANGYLAELPLQQVFSVKDKRFLPDRYVMGTCPKCGYEAARGDQCENCTSVLDPVDLIAPRSVISGSTDLEIRATQHLFLKMDMLSDDLRKWVESHGEWSRLTRSIALKWLNEGLQERCITRDLQWGISVPRNGFEGKVFYVWFDAPIGYLGATKEWSDKDLHHRNWEDWWFNTSDVTYTQFMGKDNVPFHTVFFPAMILGTCEPWTMASQIKSFNWLTYYGGKFSTSQKRGIFLDDALNLFDADYWRYFLLANAPESTDTSFTWDLFATVLNKDLVGIFGNFINRTLKFVSAQFGNVVPSGGIPTEVEDQLEKDCQKVLSEYRNHFKNLQFRKAIQSLRALWTLGNVYLDRRAPWNLVKENRDEAAMVLRTAINLIRYFAVAAQPVIPFSTAKVFDALRLTDHERQTWINEDIDLCFFEPGRIFTVPEPLFRRIEKSELANLEQRFSGQQ
ncbi:methionine--tRNA ligase [Ferroacidibacillus organovorans]|uniref:Methionine--tRNA ligase n=1 Tax=Ferroacidibacillus organovorans TaxID=1765683 RepID=A0A101XS44_9BACL|nr:methionine--tRNA ligase [Ferroacidibacillus organovorans]KUO96505.1 methionine--tRNA ligase [Ferroacidibacillus organovorans]